MTETLNRRLTVIERVITCTRCDLHKQCESPVPFSGDTPNTIAVIGQAPSAAEDDAGQPFIGRVGRFVRKQMTDVGIDPDKVSWLNTVQCAPRTKAKLLHMKACRVNKVDMLSVIDPKFILVIGEGALFGQDSSLKMDRMQGRPFLVDGRINFALSDPADGEAHLFREGLERFQAIVSGDGWTQFVSDFCSACEDWAVWFGDNGVPYCEVHAPDECAQWKKQALVNTDLEPQQLAL